MPGIFISYRREDSIAHAGRLYDRLVGHFGRERVFMDIDTLDFGVDFVDAIQKTVASCDALIAVIGKQWLDSRDDSGRRRLDNPEDFVRVEIDAALERGVRVIPILVGGARMPHSADLPDGLNKLARRNALDIPDMHFSETVGRLLTSLEKLLASADQSRLAEEEKSHAEAEQRRLDEQERSHAEAEQRRVAEQEKSLAEAEQRRLIAEANPVAPVDDSHRRKDEASLLRAGESNQLPTIVTILSACRSREFLIAPEIPTRVLYEARQACEVPESESVLAVLDCSGMGTATEAIAFAPHALYFRTVVQERLDVLQKGSLAYFSLPEDEDRIGVLGGALSFEADGALIGISLRHASTSARFMARLLIELKRASARDSHGDTAAASSRRETRKQSA